MAKQEGMATMELSQNILSFAAVAANSRGCSSIDSIENNRGTEMVIVEY